MPEVRLQHGRYSTQDPVRGGGSHRCLDRRAGPVSGTPLTGSSSIYVLDVDRPRRSRHQGDAGNGTAPAGPDGATRRRAGCGAEPRDGARSAPRPLTGPKNKGPQPKYVRACMMDWWTFAFAKKSSPRAVRAVPFRCKSWRHKGTCAAEKGGQDAARIAAAIAGRERDAFFLTLTFDPREEPDPFASFAAVYRCWRKASKRIRRGWGAFGYVATVEQTKRGWAHFHAVLFAPGLRKAAAAADWAGTGWKSFQAAMVGSGFGRIMYMDPVRTPAAAARYIAKLSIELARADVKDQTPVDAPPHFRRLRASRGVLPPPKKTGAYLGRLLKCPITSIREADLANTFDKPRRPAVAFPP